MKTGKKKNYKEIKKYCAEEIILNSYFLHFAGTLKDAAKVWKIDNFFSDKKLMKLNLAFNSKQKKLKPKFKKSSPAFAIIFSFTAHKCN